jgi:uncharacterized protein YerC
MKEHRALTPRQEALAERALFGAILTLRSVEECRAFFRDLCTPAELQALADRWAVAPQPSPFEGEGRTTAVVATSAHPALARNRRLSEKVSLIRENDDPIRFDRVMVWRMSGRTGFSRCLRVSGRCRPDRAA